MNFEKMKHSETYPAYKSASKYFSGIYIKIKFIFMIILQRYVKYIIIKTIKKGGKFDYFVLPFYLKLYGINGEFYCNDLNQYLQERNKSDINILTFFSSAGCIQILDTEYFYKVAFFEKSCKQNQCDYKKYKIVKNDIRTANLFIDDLQLNSFNNLQILISPKISVVPAFDRINSLKFILDSMKKHGTLQKAKLSTMMEAGLDAIDIILENSELSLFFRNKLHGFTNQVLRYGPIHGDLHSQNVMIQNDKYVMIDTTRVDLCSIQAFDALHAFVIMAKGKKYWTVFLAECLEKGFDSFPEYTYFKEFIDIDEKYLGYYYFLERLGMEFSDMITMSYVWKLNMINFVNSAIQLTGGEINE